MTGFARTGALSVLVLSGLGVLGLFGSQAPVEAETATFVRGDVNQSGELELTDAIRLFGFLFLGGQPPVCLDAADTDDTGSLDISDGIFILGYLFTGGRPPTAPFPTSGGDPTDDSLGCDGPQACIEWVNSVGMTFVFIPPGSFLMGSEESERGHWHVEGPVHQVHVTRGFHMESTEVTQAQYEAVMGVNPSFFHGGKYGVELRRPVEGVNVEDVEEFCRRLSDLEGQRYRLPTEAEWEYACRAGTTTRYFFGDALDCSDECEPCPEAAPYVWWCGDDSATGTKPVAEKSPNPWCLYDMSGGVWEWCLDWSSRYTPDEVWDPQGPPTGVERVIRGGYWGYDLAATRSAMRGDLSTEHRYEFLGFRVVLETEEGERK